MKRSLRLVCLLLGLVTLLSACAGPAATTTASPPAATVPPEARWGVYALDLASSRVRLIYSTNDTIGNLDLDPAGKTFAFSRRIGGSADTNEELVPLPMTGGTPARLTDNSYLDTYPVWSPDGRTNLFLAKRGETLDIYIMDRDGGHQRHATRSRLVGRYVGLEQHNRSGSVVDVRDRGDAVRGRRVPRGRHVGARGPPARRR